MVEDEEDAKPTAKAADGKASKPKTSRIKSTGSEAGSVASTVRNFARRFNPEKKNNKALSSKPSELFMIRNLFIDFFIY